MCYNNYNNYYTHHNFYKFFLSDGLKFPMLDSPLTCASCHLCTGCLLATADSYLLQWTTHGSHWSPWNPAQSLENLTVIGRTLVWLYTMNGRRHKHWDWYFLYSLATDFFRVAILKSDWFPVYTQWKYKWNLRYNETLWQKLTSL